MARFLIEVEHEGDAIACARAQHEFLGSGSNYLTHADWGCEDGVHSAWLIVESETRDEVRGIVARQNPSLRESLTIPGGEGTLPARNAPDLRDRGCRTSVWAPLEARPRH